MTYTTKPEREPRLASYRKLVASERTTCYVGSVQDVRDAVKIATDAGGRVLLELIDHRADKAYVEVANGSQPKQQGA